MKKDFSYKNTLKIISIYFSGFYFVFGTLSSFVYVKYFITHSWQRVPLPKLYVDPPFSDFVHPPSLPFLQPCFFLLNVPSNLLCYLITLTGGGLTMLTISTNTTCSIFCSMYNFNGILMWF